MERLVKTTVTLYYCGGLLTTNRAIAAVTAAEGGRGPGVENVFQTLSPLDFYGGSAVITGFARLTRLARVLLGPWKTETQKYVINKSYFLLF